MSELKVKKHSVYEKDIRNLSTTCDYLILDSTRGTGKSYSVKEYVLQNALNNEEFVYLRRRREETKDIDVIDYFSDINVSKITKGKYECVNVFRKRIYFANIEDERIVNKKKIGYVQDLFHMEEKKSLAYPNVTSIIFEEYCTDKYYLDNEPTKFLHLVSTIFRERKGFCILIGNKLNIFNPYYEFWGLDNALKQEVGTIDTYKCSGENTETIIKVWNIKKIEKASNMFFGYASKNIDGNEYYLEEQNKLYKGLSDYKCLYECVLKTSNIAFLMKFLVDKKDSKNFTWYVIPKTSEIYPRTRVISDVYNPNVFWTKGFTPLTKNEKFLFSYIQQDKIAFCTDRCGTDFRQALKRVGC